MIRYRRARFPPLSVRCAVALGLVVLASLLCAPGARADITLATWNLGWHLDLGEAAQWIAACDKRYALDDASRTWRPSSRPDARLGWHIDWRASAAGIALPWSLDRLPPCDVYKDARRTTIAVTPQAYQLRLQQIGKVLASQAAADVYAFQEVSGERAVADALGPLAAAYHICSYSGFGLQRLAFAWRKSLTNAAGICEVYAPLSLPQLGDQRRPRPGLRLTLALDGRKVAFLNVHLKSRCVSPLERGNAQRGQLDGDNQDCRTLHSQLRPLEAWIEQTSRMVDHFVILGDFNRDLWHESANAGSAPARADGSDPRGPLHDHHRARSLLAEINDAEPPRSTLVLARTDCTRTPQSAAMCESAKSTRLPGPEVQKLAREMGCRNPVGLDHVLVGKHWTRLPMPPVAEKIAIAPYGTSRGPTRTDATAKTYLAISDHCPLRITLPRP